MRRGPRPWRGLGEFLDPLRPWRVGRGLLHRGALEMGLLRRGRGLRLHAVPAALEDLQGGLELLRLVRSDVQLPGEAPQGPRLLREVEGSPDQRVEMPGGIRLETERADAF